MGKQVLGVRAAKTTIERVRESGVFCVLVFFFFISRGIARAGFSHREGPRKDSVGVAE